MLDEKILATRTSRMAASAIREILKVLGQPGMISLAGGIPSPDSYPIDLIRQLADQVLTKYGHKALQYDLTEGFLPLREEIVKFVNKKGFNADVPNVLITSGSQGALDAIGKVFVSRGDKIGMEAPTYLGAIQAFNPYGPEYVSMETDEDGLIPEAFEKTIQQHGIKLAYLIPTFQNPSGRTITLARRKKIAAIAQKYNTLIIEDDPYSMLRFKGEEVPALRTLAPDHVAYMGTFSKILAPGLRLGYTIAPPIVTKWMTLSKQGVDLHSGTFGQAIAAEYLAGGYLEPHVEKIIRLYAPKLQAMLDALEKYFPKNWNYSKPEGGMFVWAEGPKGIDTEKLYPKCVERKAAFVPGKFFYTNMADGLATMRLNFTMATEQQIHTAIEIIADVLKQAS
ncbi:MAG: PLP-dependent aminotransferase family protein [bacterium]